MEWATVTEGVTGLQICVRVSRLGPELMCLVRFDSGQWTAERFGLDEKYTTIAEHRTFVFGKLSAMLAQARRPEKRPKRRPAG